MEYITHYQSPLGLLTISSDGQALTGLWFADQKYYGSTLEVESTEITMNDKNIQEKEMFIFRQTKEWLDRYFHGTDPGPLPPLAPKGTPFRQMVWEILKEIPYGEVITYGDIAQRIASMTGRKKMSAQAVGGAVGHNPIGIIVPCHRVVGSGGNLTGYAGGLGIKEELLRLEGHDMNTFYRPKKGTAL